VVVHKLLVGNVLSKYISKYKLTKIAFKIFSSAVKILRTVILSFIIIIFFFELKHKLNLRFIIKLTAGFVELYENIYNVKMDSIYIQ